MALAWTLPEVSKPEQWRLHASCRSVDPDLFFPVGATGLALDQIDSAKAVCRMCPVHSPCLEYALATNQDSGVWGGTSEDERRSLRRAWLRQRRATA
ncbi:MAG: WhiB family transcriptional regulator, redox-sensing transcriptional regulator [Actinomycetota bacterium]|jgi:WhiB family redox-sensing transcriptional regulator|nr:WhiB family transcriptional regulator, redox-sensing transcriptional regulator [Actinomycetota bacterium]